MSVRKYLNLFVLEKFKRGQEIYSQGEETSKVYIVFQGDFEIIRRKNNKITKKEVAYNQVRFMNNRQ